MAEDIGTWFSILEIMSVVCVMTNCLIISFTSKQLVIPLSLRWRFWIMIIFEHGILLFKVLLAALIPDVPERIEQARLREAYQLQVALTRALEGDPTQSQIAWYDRLDFKFDVDEAESTKYVAKHFEEIWQANEQTPAGYHSLKQIYADLEIPEYTREVILGSRDAAKAEGYYQ